MKLCEVQKTTESLKNSRNLWKIPFLNGKKFKVNWRYLNWRILEFSGKWNEKRWLTVTPFLKSLEIFTSGGSRKLKRKWWERILNLTKFSSVLVKVNKWFNIPKDCITYQLTQVSVSLNTMVQNLDALAGIEIILGYSRSKIFWRMIGKCLNAGVKVL